MRDTTANTMTLQDKRKGQMLMQLQALDQELSSDRQTARFESLYSYDKCPTVHPFKDGLLDLDVSH